MPRPARILVRHGLYHVTARGNRRQPLFIEGHDRDSFLRLLAKVAARLGWRCYAYCLMPNHYHLVAQTPNGDLSAGIQYLNGCYAQRFNWKHSLDGHLFQGRFHSVLIESEWHLLELTRYLSLNPVRAGLCESPREWTWSSYRATAGLCSPLPFLSTDVVLGYFGRDRARARQRFEAFVADLAT